MKGAAATILFLIIVVVLAWFLFVIPGGDDQAGYEDGVRGEHPDYIKFAGLMLALTFFYFYFEKA